MANGPLELVPALRVGAGMWECRPGWDWEGSGLYAAVAGKVLRKALSAPRVLFTS